MKNKLFLILGLVLVLSMTACTNNDEPELADDTRPPVEEVETPEDDPELEEPGQEEEEPAASETASDKWPEGFMPSAPKLDGEIVLAKEEGPKKMFLEFKDVTHDEASEYVASIKAAGFTEHTNEQINSNIVKYKGMDSDKNLLVFIWKEEITKLELIKEAN